MFPLALLALSGGALSLNEVKVYAAIVHRAGAHQIQLK